jgi:glutathione S-transferase
LVIQKNKNAAALSQAKDASSELPFDLKSVAKNDAKSVESLDEHLASNSYISGFEPTAADNLVFEAIAKSAQLNGYPNLLRWHKHIESFGNERKQFAVKIMY